MHLKKILYTVVFLIFNIAVAQNLNKEKQIILENFKTESNKIKKYFEKDPNPLKLEAAFFLLENMYSHKTIISEFKDVKGRLFDYKDSNYETAEEANEALEGFKKSGGKHKLKTIFDVESIDAKMIIANIENSFEAWDNGPWKSSYDFNVFCEYILPYRNTTEPVVYNWKKKYYEDYKYVIYTAEDPTDPVSVCTSFLNEISYYEFLKKRANPQPALSIDQIHNRGKGSCVDLASLSVLNSRALGLAVTYDFTPYHAASSNSHYWNTILNKDGKYIPFNGNKDLPYIYNANYRRIGKVLRKTFSNPKNHITRYVKPSRIPGKKLREKNVIDVTDEYVKTYDVNYKFASKVLDNVAYLSVFNKGKWKVTWWGKADSNGNAVFKNMGANIVYLPAQTMERAEEGKTKLSLELEKFPLLLSEKGDLQVLKPNFKNTYSCSISRNNEVVGPYRDFNTVELIDEQKFKLYYWEGSWKYLNEDTVKNSSLTFKDLPYNALFRLLPKKEDRFERIFTIDSKNCKIKWF